MYEGPINIIQGEMQAALEGEILKVVQKVGIDVNKEELIRALNYDRSQYEKGYADAKAKIIRCNACKWWGRKDVFKDGSAMIVCKQGRSIDADGFCHHAERREE